MPGSQHQSTKVGTMTISDISFARDQKSRVVALHCSLGSGRQWSRLTEALGPGYRAIAPDVAGYGDNRGSFDLPLTLADEVAFLLDRIDTGTGRSIWSVTPMAAPSPSKWRRPRRSQAACAA
jgi:pimeloyl-ACP methyl ester carboxylesterase